MSAKHKKTCLIISYGPVPTPSYQKIEGGGMRCWGLALGLTAQDYDVTVAINGGFPLDINHTPEGIKLTNWQLDQQLIEQINTFDVVIVSYCMGDPTSFIVDHISDHVTLVLDCYVPIYIEVSARDSEDVATEYINYSRDIKHFNKALARGDFFLCANEPQKHMYMGVLSALGLINPYSYKKHRVLVVPFGVESNVSISHPRNPYLELPGIDKKDFVMLWFGGLYPWFNIKPLLNAIQTYAAENKSFKFVIVGGKNPYNNHPDFVRQYETTHQFAEDTGLLGTSMHFVDWVDFADRINWYQHADVVISINNVGEENNYSWRTRVMDYVWGEVPMITNGGDPLSNELLAASAAIQLESLDEKHLYETVKKIADSAKLLKTTKHNLLRVKERYHWEKVVLPLHERLAQNEQPYLEEKQFRLDSVPAADLLPPSSKRAKIAKLRRLPLKLARKIKQKGIRRSFSLAAVNARNRLVKASRPGKRYYFFSHPIDFTGAPLALLDAVKDFSEQVSSKDISVVYPGGEKPLLRRLHGYGVLPEKMILGIGSRIIHAQLGIKKDDFVLLNTVAIYPNYRDYIFGLLDDNRLTKATWFIHEDKPELRFDDKGLIERVKRLVREGKLQIVVPSKQTAREYNDFFATNTVQSIDLRVEVGTHADHERPAKDFDSLRFVISGTPSDGRKGQILAISAFYKYLNDYQQKNPSHYRPFELHLISIGDDYISQQIKALGGGLLQDKVHYYPKIAKDKAMDITDACNVTVCCSLNETFGLFVAEGMLMGHVLLRNRSSGYEEQLVDGINGLTIDSNDISDFANKIERLLNKKATTNQQLHTMSQQSKKLALPYENANYWQQLNR